MPEKYGLKVVGARKAWNGCTAGWYERLSRGKGKMANKWQYR